MIFWKELTHLPILERSLCEQRIHDSFLVSSPADAKEEAEENSNTSEEEHSYYDNLYDMLKSEKDKRQKESEAEENRDSLEEKHSYYDDNLYDMEKEKCEEQGNCRQNYDHLLCYGTEWVTGVSEKSLSLILKPVLKLCSPKLLSPLYSKFIYLSNVQGVCKEDIGGPSIVQKPGETR